MRQVLSAERGLTALVAGLDRALGRLLGPVVDLLPRRLRRAAEKLEKRRKSSAGQIAAAGFLLVSVIYGLVVGGQIGRVGDSLLVVLGFGIETVEIVGQAETAELTVLETLQTSGSLVNFDVVEAQTRLDALPWVERASVRKFYPSTLAVGIIERKPFALWQRKGEVYVMDRSGAEIVSLDESRFGGLPFTVGDGANVAAAELIDAIAAEPAIAAQMRAAVLVAGRRWNLHLEHGVTVKLPETGLPSALRQLVRLDAERQLLARDVVVVDLRLPDRVTVRLPEGRTMEEVTGEDAADAGKART